MSEVVRYGEQIKELAKVCYMQTEGNVSAATRLLKERIGAGACPDRSVVSKWAKEGQWGLQRTQAVAEAMPYITVEQAGRMVLLADQALDVYERILQMDSDSPGVIREQRAVAQHILELRGIGTAGARWGGGGDLPSLPPVAQDDDAALSPQERQRRRLEGES